MFILPDLSYPPGALEPYIDEETMRLHHDVHHASYVKNLNEALAGKEEFLNMDAEDLIGNLDDVPEGIRVKVRNNGGQHANHSLFWQIMAPSGAKIEPEGDLVQAIAGKFGDFGSFKSAFSELAAGLFGSGWTWLSVDEGNLIIETTPNGDSPFMAGHTPILGLDVWEHAYYLKYKNNRKDYIAAWWNVVNWAEVEGRFKASV